VTQYIVSIKLSLTQYIVSIKLSLTQYIVSIKLILTQYIVQHFESSVDNIAQCSFSHHPSTEQ